MRLLHLASVTTGAVILYGCAAEPVRLTPGAPPGYIATRPGKPGFVIAAPHQRTTTFLAALGLVVATGFALEPDRPDGPGRRYQVNRPLEGVPGRPAAQEVSSDGARRVYEAYEQRVRAVAQGPLAFYVEIHGNNRREAAQRIEIATVGTDRNDALRLKTLLELIRDAHRRARPGSQRLDVLVEPAHPVMYGASSAKRVGIFRLPAQALHIELPKTARVEGREVYTAILADFLVQAAGYDPGR